ncbi:MAG TPA: ABC transporter permease [Bryobacteraceae bacterium]|nr:ABC transporter permease [Bryobacteraceae bacterium]
MQGILEDLRFSLRTLLKNRGFATVAALSLALGIGANTTIFTLVNSVLLRPLLVSDPGQLVSVFTIDPQNPGYLLCSYPNYKDFRDRNQVFSSLFIYSALDLSLTGSGDPKPIVGDIVSGTYFSTLGIHFALGRGFRADEDQIPGADPVAVISYSLWTRQFGGRRDVLGRTVGINGHPFQIIGVTPPDFHGLNTLVVSDVWVPMMMNREVYPNPMWLTERRALVFSVVGRLKPGVEIPRAQAGMDQLAAELARDYPRDNQGRQIQLEPLTEAAINPNTRTILTNGSALLMTIAALVLLIACANVANLLLARASGRGKEIAVRLAMGASRWRLIRQLLTESTVLALIGGGLGLILARWARDILWSARPPILATADFHVDLDGRVLGFTLVISVLTGILFGLAPALRATRKDLATDLKERAGQPVSPPGKFNSKAALVMAQVALSLVALTGAGLFLRSLRNAQQINPGFDTEHTGILEYNLAERAYSEMRGREFEQRVMEMASRTPGVVSAALATNGPLHVTLARTVLLAGQEDITDGKGRTTAVRTVTPGYFRTLMIPLLHGRDFGETDTKDSPRVAIVNEAAAARYWPDQDPLGKQFRFFGDDAPFQVVGVARNASSHSIGERPQALIYTCLAQNYWPTNMLHVRAAGSPDAVLASVRRQIHRLDPDLLLHTSTIAGEIAESLWAPRLAASLLGVFGLLALLLASIGIYGVASYSVNQRVREIGIRVALGATTSDVERMVLLEGMRLVALGVVMGLAVALAASRAVESMLFVISAQDVWTFALVPAVLTLVGIAACWFPARRATRVDPAVALRHE